MRQTLKDKYLKRLERWGRSTTSHGIPNIFKSKNRVVRFVWVFFFLASFGYCAYAIIMSIIKYSKYQTTVSIHKMQQVPQSFPAVTICNLNLYNETNVLMIELFNNAIQKPECLDYFKLFKKCNERTFVNMSMCRENYFKLLPCWSPSALNIDQVKRFIANRVTDDIIDKKDLGVSFDDLVYRCTFNTAACSRKNFTRFWTHEFGNCFTFNGEENKQMPAPKVFENGLELHVNLKREYRRTPDYAFTRGLYLIVHNQSEVPFTVKNNGIVLSPGFSHNIQIDRTYINKLSSPYSNCIDELKSDHPYSRRLFGFFRDLNLSYYDQQVCFNLCRQDKLIDRCGCSDLITTTIRGAPYCMNYSDIFNCMSDFYATYLTNEFTTFCNAACPEKCKTVEYEVSINSGFYTHGNTMQALKYVYPRFKDLPDDDNALLWYGHQSVLTLGINYKNTYYTLIEENAATTFEELLGNIGGQLGLFIGISFLSLIEIIEITIELIYYYYKYKITESNMPPSANPYANQIYPVKADLSKRY